jgi:hypothetical protein
MHRQVLVNGALVDLARPETEQPAIAVPVGSARDTIRKISFKPTGRRSSHLLTDQDLPARHPDAGPSQPQSADICPGGASFGIHSLFCVEK